MIDQSVCDRCPIYNDQLLQIGVRKTHQIQPRTIPNTDRKRVLIMAECGSEPEDQQNRVLVGRSGKLIDKLMAESGLDQFNVMLSNVVKCRAIQCVDGKYKNRNPNEEEIKACSPYLKEDWAFDPDLIIMLGKSALKGVMPNRDLPRGKGVEIDVNGRTIIAVHTFHPAACLYDPRNKPELLKHLTNAVKYLTELEKKDELNAR